MAYKWEGITVIILLIHGFLFIWNKTFTLRKKCPYLELFWSTFSRIRTPFSVRIQKNADKNNSKYERFLRCVRLYFSTLRLPLAQSLGEEFRFIKTILSGFLNCVFVFGWYNNYKNVMLEMTRFAQLGIIFTI